MASCTRSATSLSIVDLPDEIMLLIFAFADGYVLLNVRRVCHLWKAWSHDNSLWRQLCVNEGCALERKPRARTYEWLYWSTKRVLPSVSWTTNGPACVHFPDESTYYGDFEHGIRHGYGYFESPKQATYNGEWHNDQQTGKGVKVMRNGDRYEGDFVAGLRSGYGVFTWAMGNKYEGQWKADHPHGEGKKRWASGDMYAGQWVEGFRVGFGIYTWPVGDCYEGNHVASQRSGKGCYKWADKRRYVGEWKDGAEHGEGTYTWPDGSIFTGFWLNGLREGSGTMKWPDGTVWEGQWMGDFRVDHSADVKQWDGFFTLTFQQQRAEVNTYMATAVDVVSMEL